MILLNAAFIVPAKWPVVCLPVSVWICVMKPRVKYVLAMEERTLIAATCVFSHAIRRQKSQQSKLARVVRIRYMWLFLKLKFLVAVLDERSISLPLSISKQRAQLFVRKIDSNTCELITVTC